MSDPWPPTHKTTSGISTVHNSPINTLMKVLKTIHVSGKVLLRYTVAIVLGFAICFAVRTAMYYRMISRLAAPNPDVRFDAVCALCDMPDARAYEPLLQRLIDPKEVRYGVQRSPGFGEDWRWPRIGAAGCGADKQSIR